MRARIAIKLCDIKVELREVLLKKIPTEMSNISPKSTVPVLLLPDGTVLEESIDIMNWAFAKKDIDYINNSKNQNKEIIKKFIKLFDKEFKYHLDRYKYFSRYKNEKNIENPVHHREKCLEKLTHIEKLLNNNNLWIFDDKPSYLDIAILPFIRQYRISNTEWFDNEMPLKKVKSWLNRFLIWTTFEKIMVKNPLWEDSKSKIYFGQD
tara:strand:- start:124 stop:747 length:624 start_codon:yes stop_codon:yes gene_type:complete